MTESNGKHKIEKKQLDYLKGLTTEQKNKILKQITDLQEKQEESRKKLKKVKETLLYIWDNEE